MLLGELEPDALVVTDVTPDGKALTQPTAEKPVYYYYKPGGFRELGEVIANEKRPSPERIEQLLAKALEKRHYLRATKETPPPTIIVAAWWGTMNPGATTELGFHEDENVGVEISEHNKKQMLMIVGGSKFTQNGWINSEQARVMQEAVEDRFFLFVSAYDAATAVKKEKKPLWFTRISLPSAGVSMDDVMATLVTSGGPFYGKETKSVEFIDPTKIRKAEVRLGDVVVIPDDPKPPAPVETPAQPKP
ncbi:hypothetical protein [Nibricoccus aquaticus]|uniref:hypothetical protein n=1 Tax=Nibricoccus aquaticus TaxID=2576891 RepID=UPI001C2F48CB|nr:hypothetical protein [Nibricoccus aquaticus]